MGAIYRRELGSFFNSAIGPVFLTVFYLGSGVLFWLFCLNYARTDMSNYFAWMRLVMVLILPLLTMRLLSEERAQKTDQGLLTAPVSLGGIVLGKYFAALTVYAMGIAIVFVYAILLSFFGTVAWSIVFSNFIALFLMGAAFMAITLFLSAFTANQFIAYVLGIVSLVVLYMIDYLSGTVSSSADSLSSKSTVLSTLVGWLGNAMESVSFFSRIYDLLMDCLTCPAFCSISARRFCLISLPSGYLKPDVGGKKEAENDYGTTGCKADQTKTAEKEDEIRRYCVCHYRHCHGDRGFSECRCRLIGGTVSERQNRPDIIQLVRSFG